MALHQLLVVFLVICVRPVKCLPSRNRLCLLGWTGDGKTEFCNKYDGTICPRESGETEEESRTTKVYFGQSILDTPGFGENREIVQAQTVLHASLEAIKKTLMAINQTFIRALVWMVPCTERSTKKEAFDLMNLFKDMVGNNVPIVAVFNPGSPKNSCVKDPVGFQRLASKHSIDVREVIYFDSFNLPQFEQKYMDAFHVIIPDNLEEILQKKDPHFLASQLKKIRDLRCQSLPKEIESIRKTIAEFRAMLKGEDTIPLCQRGSCELEKANYRDCTKTICVEQKESCSGWGPFRDCDTYCSKSEIVEDQGCLQSNAAKTKRAEEEFRQCQEKIKVEEERCLKSREETLSALRVKNAGLKKSIDLLVQSENENMAKMRTCDDTFGINGKGTEQDEL